tara:strand:+ start:97 stop:759 length:663 start_codon:yes stop_codon:yes gene_type:complete
MNTNLLNIKNVDCMKMMADYPNDYFDLAVVDPPYGIGEDGAKNHSRGKLAPSTKFTPKNWDKESPEVLYFDELKRVSKNQIIWGANHFIEKIKEANSSSWIVWDKDNGDTDFADCELAWTSHKSAVRKFEFKWQGMLQGDMKNKEKRIHPTQKPVRLYDWIFQKYAKEGYRILDTHLGSGSIAIAAHYAGLNLTACEIDKEYFKETISRIQIETSQQVLF